MAHFSDWCNFKTDLDSGPNFFCVFVICAMEHFDGVFFFNLSG